MTDTSPAPVAEFAPKLMAARDDLAMSTVAARQYLETTRDLIDMYLREIGAGQVDPRLGENLTRRAGLLDDSILPGILDARNNYRILLILAGMTPEEAAIQVNSDQVAASRRGV